MSNESPGSVDYDSIKKIALPRVSGQKKTCVCEKFFLRIVPKHMSCSTSFWTNLTTLSPFLAIFSRLNYAGSCSAYLAG